MATSTARRLPTKRERDDSPEPTTSTSSSIQPPTGDVTRERIDEFFDRDKLSDRQRLSWAYQTEARVRLGKVERRGTIDDVSTSLDSEYLFDVYPQIIEEEEDNASGEVAKDRHTFRRKCRPAFTVNRLPDDSFQSIYAVDTTTSSHHRERFQCCLTMDDDDDDTKPKPSSSSLLPDNNRNLYRKAPVPPNLLFFRIIVEAFMGYNFVSFHVDDPVMPRCAIMGGTVVAALTAWRDHRILELFQAAKLDELIFYNNDENGGDDAYLQAKKQLLTNVHQWFLYTPVSRDQSPFSTGDVDIFLQSSPFTRSLMKKLHSVGLDEDLRDHVQSFLGGCGYVEDDLFRMGHKVFHEDLAEKLPKDDDEGYRYNFRANADIWKDGNSCSFVFALTKHALNAMVTTPQEDSNFVEGTNWLRTTQLIMLNEKADLLGSVLDFDISLTCCAYDGTGVWVAPRAAFSLLTLTQVATPFIMEDARNWKRIVKYYKRGFQPYVLDQNCRHEVQCTKGPFPTDSGESDGETGNQNANHGRCGHLAGRSLRGQINYSELYAFQDEHGWKLCCHSIEEIRHHRTGNIYNPSHSVFEREEGEVLQFFASRNGWSESDLNEIQNLHPWQRVSCQNCRRDYLNYSFSKAHSERGHLAGRAVRGRLKFPELYAFQEEHGTKFCCHEIDKKIYPGMNGYAHSVYEREEGEALQFFASKHGWSESEQNEIRSLHPWQRVSCRRCRYDYENYAFLKRNPGKSETVDDVLRGEQMFVRQEGRNLFHPRWYSGGVFDSRRILRDAFFHPKALAGLSSQLEAEEARYFVKNNSLKGYLPRFAYADNIRELFQAGSGKIFPALSRPPVGLNPERFVAACKSCRKWLLDSEFGVAYCELCDEMRKPEAKSQS